MATNNEARRIADCGSLPELWQVLIAYFTTQGFGSICYFAHGPADGVAANDASDQPRFLHGFTPEASAAYLDSDFKRLDVVPRLAMAHGRPLRWHEAWSSVDLNDEERAFLDSLQAAGLGDGFSLPCYGPMGRHAFIGIGGMTPGARTTDEALGEMHIIAQGAHLRYCALMPAERALDRALSGREKEILEWVARGKSNGVIADILSISAGTVDTYLRRIYEKLGVSDRTSAAVRGIGMGLIAA